jgi:hypothetical protein
MSRLVLERRDDSRNAGVKKQRLEVLADHFLRTTGQERESDSIAHIGKAVGARGVRASRCRKIVTALLEPTPFFVARIAQTIQTVEANTLNPRQTGVHRIEITGDLLKMSRRADV